MQFNKDCERNKTRDQTSGVLSVQGQTSVNFAKGKLSDILRSRDTPYLQFRNSGKSDQVLGFPFGRAMRDLDAGTHVPKSLIF